MRRLGHLTEKTGAGPHAHVERHHERLAQRVDRRVRYLCETLLHIAEHTRTNPRQHGERCVVAHRENGVEAVARHGLEDVGDVFAREPIGVLGLRERAVRQNRRRAVAVGRVGRGRDGRELDQVLGQPVAVGRLGGDALLGVGVVQEKSAFRVDGDDLPRTEPSLLHHARGVDVEHADFRCHADRPVVADHVPRRAEAVAVKRRADPATVAVGQRRGSVPRLGETGVIVVEVPQRLGHLIHVLPRFRDEHHPGMDDRPAAGDQELQRVVQAV